jgi:polyhydroxyalkanoate synthesis repressor PhaR
LYDTEESRYITLADVRKLVLDGVSFQVLDSQSGEDLTRSILLQIISEQEQGGEPLFSADMLSKFIRFYGGTAQEAFTTYLDRSLEMFIDQQRVIQERMGEAMTGNPVSAMMKMTESNLALWKEMQDRVFRSMGFGAEDPERKGTKGGE